MEVWRGCLMNVVFVCVCGMFNTVVGKHFLSRFSSPVDVVGKYFKAVRPFSISQVFILPGNGCAGR